MENWWIDFQMAKIKQNEILFEAETLRRMSPNSGKKRKSAARRRVCPDILDKADSRKRIAIAGAMQTLDPCREHPA